MTETNQIKLSINFYRKAVLALLFILLCRLVAMYFVPLMDTTESRYSEIAREMLRSHNWITLYHHYGTPFLAKPPLSTWLTAFSFQLFGLNALAARLPSLLLSLGLLGLIWSLAKKRNGQAVATITILFLSSCLYFYLNAGATMTDASLIFCTTLSMVSFWHSMSSHSKIWSYLFFVALGLGLLAKGPVATVLTAMPVFSWVLLRHQWKALWVNLPWITGSLITLAIALPWYILAEIRTPGFLNYFIIGEHFLRFYVPEWKGNMYGYSHAKPYGAIWIYGLIGLFPWSVAAGLWLLHHGKKLPSLLREEDQGWLLYLLLWAYLPLIFFTFSKNIIYTYAFSSLPAFALLFAELWKRTGITERNATSILYLTSFIGLSFLVATTVIALNPDKMAKSQKMVVSLWKKQNPPPHSKLIYWATRLEYSAQFYSDGKALSTRNLYYLAFLLASNPNSYLVINAPELPQIPPNLLAKFKQVAETRFLNCQLLLLYNQEKVELSGLGLWR
ncbi:ArnT family glycosyltransferase [Legionella maceachernii]|uniref:Melitin resistance protein n=1 Tax=Legionella maceachernii TaxID=466 RepID=A0A0W0WGK8_9GAMM|nr:glycosyltransferase family 39 protein [Legionella maceachernii]KTD31468.1 melitin resistance protein [Legionella maceachernii]SJZ94149.1 Dolichyl-phosphate-mannose-protein mannosyltransferase [Legionella maceachernii]SUP03395.1 Undecaprenyl phosphate-alpha-4-amino-4-deoxy-L-arabinose arabinosyl transferase [Legionella maceachernii]